MKTPKPLVSLFCIVLLLGGILACDLSGTKQPTPVSVVTLVSQVVEATPTPSLVTLSDGSQIPLPGDAKVVPVVEGFYTGFTTGLIEPQLFDFYAAWLSQRGWVMVAPTEAVVSQPHQRWRKGDLELLIELQSPDEQGRTAVWLQVSSLPPQPTATEGVVSPTDTPLPSPTTITPENVGQLAEVSWVQIGGNVQDLAWSPDGRWLAVSEARQLRLYETDTLTPVSLPSEIEASLLTFSPDGAYLATPRYEESGQILVKVWQVVDWTLVRTLEGHPRAILDLAFSPDGSLLASAAADARVRLWQPSSGELVHELEVSYTGVHPPGVLSVAFSPDGKQVVAGVYGGSVQGWQVDDGTQTINFQAASLPQPNDVIFLPDGLLVTTEGYGADLWQLDGTHLAALKGDSSVYDGSVSPDGQVLAIADHASVELWDIANQVSVHRLDVGGAKLAFSPDGAYLATVGDDKILRLWGVAF